MIGLLAIGGVVCLLFVGCVVCVQSLSSSSDGGTTHRSAVFTSTIDETAVAKEACDQLVATGFVSYCPTASATGPRTSLEATPSGGFVGDRLHVTVDAPGAGPTDADTAADAGREALPADYPDLRVTSAKSGLTISVVRTTDEWNKCIASNVKVAPGASGAKQVWAITACMKRFPLQYAWFHALHDEAQMVVDGNAPAVSCTSGYLCGTGCTSKGDTCCIDVGRADRSCSGGGRCMSDGTCIGGTPPPQAVGGGGGCTCGDGTIGCCGRGCCSHHGGIR